MPDPADAVPRTLVEPTTGRPVLMAPMRQQRQGAIVHIGGFADGRLAFPYYSVDAASRAGVFTFI